MYRYKLYIAVMYTVVIQTSFKVKAFDNLKKKKRKKKKSKKKISEKSKGKTRAIFLTLS